MLDIAKVEKFISAAMKYKGDKYSQPKRMLKGYSDCSSLIYKALRDSKLLDLSKTTRTVSTKFMLDGDPRFVEIPMAQLRRGDILWGGSYKGGKWDGHVAIYLGDNKTLEARYREGVLIYHNRPYFTKAYRIKTLQETVVEPRKADVYVPIIVCGQERKAGIVIDGTTYITVNGKNIAVRDFFETLGMKVDWDSKNKIVRVN